jgi:hypothetical protein
MSETEIDTKKLKNIHKKIENIMITKDLTTREKTNKIQNILNKDFSNTSLPTIQDGGNKFDPMLISKITSLLGSNKASILYSAISILILLNFMYTKYVKRNLINKQTMSVFVKNYFTTKNGQVEMNNIQKTLVYILERIENIKDKTSDVYITASYFIKSLIYKNQGHLSEEQQKPAKLDLDEMKPNFKRRALNLAKNAITSSSKS